MKNEFLTLLNKMYNEIFTSTEELTPFEKRNKIFDYMVNNIEYDIDLWKNRIEKHIPKDYRSEVMSVLKEHKGVCNSISLVYKLLLEMTGIYSICVNTYYEKYIGHQMNLVKMGNVYSFDDITSVIIELGNKDDFFNYDYVDAVYKNKQGALPLLPNSGIFFQVVPSPVAYTIIGLDDNGINYNRVKDPNFDEDNGLYSLPFKNISKYIEDKKHTH